MLTLLACAEPLGCQQMAKAKQKKAKAKEKAEKTTEKKLAAKAKTPKSGAKKPASKAAAQKEEAPKSSAKRKAAPKEAPRKVGITTKVSGRICMSSVLQCLKMGQEIAHRTHGRVNHQFSAAELELVCLEHIVWTICSGALYSPLRELN